MALASSPESDLTESAEITDLAEEREVKLPRWAESRNAWWEVLSLTVLEHFVWP